MSGACAVRRQRPVQCEIWDPKNGKLVVDEKNLFMEFGIDPERGLVDFKDSSEKFNALVQERLAAVADRPACLNA